MKLIDSSGVCEMLGISKSTLYRWCGIKEGNEPFALGVSRGLSTGRTVTAVASGFGSIEELKAQFDRLQDEPGGFPRPFKIGRALKWDEDEIVKWLEKQRC
ncbi:hypothetical protein BVH03_24430 [Pseudomonas sp. PA15(2017)]|uniref:helix-turn-helix transcriptional regulator n=1 Tax=Pseudomonas sp. PA15(2017) TaxID=1932111 RepID=UPI00095AE4CD|nr:hypothetical protein [Pseudomonas sp. PA15(2017)]OLU22386.1 hypothetical protein BVH03_24430 [Pseudomonas sp. PA15(2017)]